VNLSKATGFFLAVFSPRESMQRGARELCENSGHPEGLRESLFYCVSSGGLQV